MSAGDNPIARVSAELQSIAKQIDELLADAAGGRVPWTLQVWAEPGGSGEMIYVGNVERADVKRAMQEVVENWDRDSHVPAHLRN